MSSPRLTVPFRPLPDRLRCTDIPIFFDVSSYHTKEEVYTRPSQAYSKLSDRYVSGLTDPHTTVQYSYIAFSFQ